MLHHLRLGKAYPATVIRLLVVLIVVVAASSIHGYTKHGNLNAFVYGASFIVPIVIFLPLAVLPARIHRGVFHSLLYGLLGIAMLQQFTSVLSKGPAFSVFSALFERFTPTQVLLGGRGVAMIYPEASVASFFVLLLLTMCIQLRLQEGIGYRTFVMDLVVIGTLVLLNRSFTMLILLGVAYAVYVSVALSETELRRSLVRQGTGLVILLGAVILALGKGTVARVNALADLVAIATADQSVGDVFLNLSGHRGLGMAVGLRSLSELPEGVFGKGPYSWHFEFFDNARDYGLLQRIRYRAIRRYDPIKPPSYVSSVAYALGLAGTLCVIILFLHLGVRCWQGTRHCSVYERVYGRFLYLNALLNLVLLAKTGNVVPWVWLAIASQGNVSHPTGRLKGSP